MSNPTLDVRANRCWSQNAYKEVLECEVLREKRHLHALGYIRDRSQQGWSVLHGLVWFRRHGQSVAS